jgi:ADP-heptose:LPS heptosyltransferase
MKKCAVFCSRGLGDGLLFLTVSNNLKGNGFEVVTYHDFLEELKPFFENLEIRKFPKKEEIKSLLSKFDLVIVNSDYSPINMEIKKELKMHKEKWILHASTSKGKNLPGNFSFDRKKTMVENLLFFCKSALHLKDVSKENGIEPIKGFTYRKNKRRIVIHPEANIESKKWEGEKFLKLSKKLMDLGFEISYIIPKEKREKYLKVKKYKIKLPLFKSLKELATYIYESGYMIGNNSGIGHLASSLKIPTFIIFASKRQKLFWKPDFGINEGIAPLSILPNIKNMRLRDKFWKGLIGVGRAFRKFKKFEKRVRKL